MIVSAFLQIKFSVIFRPRSGFVTFVDHVDQKSELKIAQRMKNNVLSGSDFKLISVQVTNYSNELFNVGHF